MQDGSTSILGSPINKEINSTNMFINTKLANQAANVDMTNVKKGTAPVKSDSVSNEAVTNKDTSTTDSLIEDYFGFPLTSHINTSIQKELTRRSINRNWQNEETAYIRVIPGAYVKNHPEKRLIFRSLQTTMDNLNTENFSFEKIYSPDISFRPVAGITGLHIDYKNAWGSLRKATLKWKVNSLTELERIMPYIGTPGRSMLIEWGWSSSAKQWLESEKDILGSGKGQNILKNSERHFKENLNKIYGSGGKIDSILGIIINYEFTLQKDGSFEGITEVMNGGYLMEGMDIGRDFVVSSYDPNKKSKIKEGSKEKTADVTILETLKDKAKTGGLMKQISDDNLSGKFRNKEVTPTKYNKIGYNDVSIKDFGGEPNKNYSDEGTRKFLYVSWGYVEDQILNPYACRIMTSENKPLFSFDSRFSRISSNADALRSWDPDVCLIPLSNNSKTITSNLVPLKSGSTETVLSSSVGDFTKQEIPAFTKGKDNLSFIEYSCPRLIMINADHLIKKLLDANNLIDFVYELFKDVNTACGHGSYWQFQIREMESANLYRDQYKNTNGQEMASIIYSIIDLEFFDKKYEEVKDKIFMFNLMSVEASDSDSKSVMYNSIVRNVNFSSKLSDQSALAVYYALNTEKVEYEVGRDMGLMYSLFSTDEEMADSFISPPEINQKDTKTSPEQAKKDEELQAARTKYENGISSFPESLHEYLPYSSSNYFPWLGISQDQQDKLYKTLASSRDVMRIALTNYKKSTDPGNQGILPVSIELEIDGISGIKVGDIFSMDYIPTMYKTRSVFQVSNISHDISSNKWITIIKAVIRVFANNVSPAVANKKSEYATKSAPAKRNGYSKVKSSDSDINDKYIKSESNGPKSIQESDYQKAAALLDVDVASIKAVASVESRGAGFLQDGRPKILYEAHVFSKYTDHAFDHSNPAISSRNWDRSLYGAGGAHQYDRLNEAIKLNEDAALKSTSWGKFQILGINYTICRNTNGSRYPSVQSFVEDQYVSEAVHLMNFVSFVKSNNLTESLRSKNWAAFAKGYNGSSYKENDYDTKLAAAYQQYA
jgi:hypothetical protein